jgi:hypothetical protein
MLPALIIRANEAGLIEVDEETGEVTLEATDAQIRVTVASLVDVVAGYYPTP